MKIITGHVVDGTIVVEGERLEEGTTVTILAKEDDESFQLSAQDEAELLVAIEQANRGDVVSGDELLRKLSNPE